MLAEWGKEQQQQLVIPAQHTTRLADILAGRQPPPVPLDRVFQQVFSADYSEVYDIPAPRIVKLTKSGKATRLVLCGKFDPTHPRSCLMGDRCNFVHADTRGVPRRAVHINYAWRTVEEVKYERFPAGRLLHVAAPGSKDVTDTMDSSMALRTNALEATAGQDRPVLTHCAHYYLNRTCNLGSECQFVHAVYLDARARPHQRAPAPTQLGREASETQVVKAIQRHQAARRVSLDSEAGAEYGVTGDEVSDDDHCGADTNFHVDDHAIDCSVAEFKDVARSSLTPVEVSHGGTPTVEQVNLGVRPSDPLVTAMLTPIKDASAAFKVADRSLYLGTSSTDPSMSTSLLPFRHEPYKARHRGGNADVAAIDASFQPCA